MITDLQTSLMAIGGIFVVGVISFNKWQEYKAKKSVDRAFSSEHDDVLMTRDRKNPATGQRSEPVFTADDDVPRPPASGTAGSQAAREPKEGEFINPTNSPLKELPIDSLIDCTIPLSLEASVRGDKILPVLQTLRHVGNQPVHFIGWREEGGWEPIAHGGVYSALQAGVQLAHRNHTLNELEYSELVTRLRQVADEIGADVEVPDMIEVMQKARGLHRFVADHDAQLGVNVESNGAPWAINTLLVVLEKQGFDLRPDGRFVMPDGDGGVLYSVSTNVTYAAETTSRLTLLLDVPCVAPAREAFGAMTGCARSLVARLDGTIVDDGNQALNDIALGDIAMQVKAFCGEMQAAGIPAGSVRALRLFS